ncbi:MAG: class I SAM-dependent methyltransferase [Myxococcota bacterium]
MAPARAKRKPGRKASPKPKRASSADRYDLYQQAVQAPDVDVLFFERVFEELHGSMKARVFREDFCGTAAMCCEWVKRGQDRVAYGVDLDPEPIAWGEEHNVNRLGDDARARVHLIEADVRDPEAPEADIVAAQNFSYCVFKTRDELRRYFSTVRSRLRSPGIFVADLFGGYESMEDDREEITEYKGFDYVWEQHRFDPVTHFGTYKIHFRFKDRSRLDDAFVYDWRLWTIPEVREVLIEAGFDRAVVYWEGTDPSTGEGTDRYDRVESGDCDPAWNAYIIGVVG